MIRLSLLNTILGAIILIFRKGDYVPLDNNKEPKFGVDFSKIDYEIGNVWYREHEPKTGYGIY